MKKYAIILLVSCLFVLVVASSASAAGFVYTPFTAVVTDLIDDLVTPATTILGAALAIAGAVLIVKIGFRWVRGFVK